MTEVNSRKVIAAFALAMALLPLASRVDGQQYGRRKPELSKYSSLASKVSIPDLPDYSGSSKYMFGNQITGRGAGVSYIEHFLVREQPDQVHEWYKTTMANYGWKITLNTKSSLYANKNSNYVSINFNGTYQQGWGSEIIIRFSPKE